MLRLILAIALCALWWWIGPLVSVGIYRPLAPVAVRAALVALTALWGLWPLGVWWLSRTPKRARPAAVPRVHDRLAARLDDTVRTLRHVGLTAQRGWLRRLRYRLGRRYLDQRPWFALLGAHGSGKSAIVPASGQRMLLSEHYGLPATIDDGPTLDCNVWLTEKAVYLDTTGAFVALDQGEGDVLSTWRGMLRRLRRLRRHRSLDGIVLCIDAAWLDAAPATMRKSLVDSLRARILEMADELRADLPVYLLLTRLDTMPGGRALLTTVNDDTLIRGMGFALPVKDADGGRAGQVDQAYRAFETSLHQQVIGLLHALPGDTARDTQHELLEVTERIGALRLPLLDMIEQLFPLTPIGFSGRLRGLWYGSAADLPAAQHGDYGQHAVRSLGRSYAAALQCAVAERGVCRQLGRGAWRRHVMQRGAYAAVGVGLIAVATLLGTRYLWERNYIDHARAGFEEARRISKDAVAAPNGRAAVVQATEQLRYMAALLSGESAQAHPLVNPYVEHGRIDAAVVDTYRQHLIKILWPEVERFVSASLSAETAARSPELFETLKVYLMLGQPERRDAAALVAWFGRRWAQLAPAGSTAADRATFDYHLHALFAASAVALPTHRSDGALIRDARIQASDLPMPERVVSRLTSLPVPSSIQGVSLALAAGDGAALGLRRAGDATMTDMAVPAIFTLAGYRDVVLQHIDGIAASVLEESSWVLAERAVGESDSAGYATAQRLSDDAQRLYLNRYAASWKTFLRDIRIRQVASLDDAAQLANFLAEPDSPLARLVRFASVQTALSAPVEGYVAGGASKVAAQGSNLLASVAGETNHADSLSQEIVDRQFESLHRLAGPVGETPAAHGEALARLFTEASSQLQTLVGALRSGKVLPQGESLHRLRGEADRQPDPVREMLNDLIRIASTQSVRESRAQLAMGASGLGSGICARAIAGRYPFNRQADGDVGLDDFARVFGRSGALQAFFDQRLAAYVNADAHPWRARAGTDTDQPIVGEATIRSFEHAAQIRESFFKSDNRLGFTVILRPVALDASVLEATLDIDGQVLQYSHGPQQTQRIDWPGPRGGVSVRVSMRHANGQTSTASFDGPWAIFRLYDASRPRVIAPDAQELTVATPSGNFKLEMRSSTQDFPLWSQALSRFRCPN
jgi:type VI secretion system protein ImpL